MTGREGRLWGIWRFGATVSLRISGVESTVPRFANVGALSATCRVELVVSEKNRRSGLDRRQSADWSRAVQEGNAARNPEFWSGRYSGNGMRDKISA
jgi:hypothetical protein